MLAVFSSSVVAQDGVFAVSVGFSFPQSSAAQSSVVPVGSDTAQSVEQHTKCKTAVWIKMFTMNKQ